MGIVERIFRGLSLGFAEYKLDDGRKVDFVHTEVQNSLPDLNYRTNGRGRSWGDRRTWFHLYETK